MTDPALKSRLRSDYFFHQSYRTRWSDNDQYAHMNNSAYYYLFDSIVNAYLAVHCGHSPTTSAQIGLVIHSHCTYISPLSFPAVAHLGLRVNKLGKSSVEYEIGVFEEGTAEVKAVGGFVHVFVDRETRKTTQDGMSESVKRGLEVIKVLEQGKL